MSNSSIPAALARACRTVRPAGPRDAVAGVVPSWVAAPSGNDEASALLATAAEHGLAVVPRGSGTRIGWGAPPRRCDLIIDTHLLNRVVEHAAGDLVARVQAGVTLRQLAGVLGAAGQQLALDPPPALANGSAGGPNGSAGGAPTIGGMLATGTSGPRRLRYGTPRDVAIGITVVRPTGIVAKSGGKVVKNVAGYDLGKLFTGSQGTLGLITEATFRLHPLPAAVAWVTAEFGPAERAEAVAAVASAASSVLVPSAVELDWPGGSQRMLRVGVLLEGTESGVAERAKQMSELLASAGGPVAVSEAAPARWGTLPAGVTVVRVSFWVSALDSVLEALVSAGAEAGVRSAVSGPAGAGALYACLDPDTSDDDAVRFVGVLRGELAESRGAAPRGSVVVLAAPPAVLAAAAAGGSVPGAALMRAVRDQFDPDHRMFPGRLAFTGGD